MGGILIEKAHNKEEISFDLFRFKRKGVNHGLVLKGTLLFRSSIRYWQLLQNPLKK